MTTRVTAAPPRRRLVVMVKEPRAGAVKTRLATDLGAGRAACLYRHLLARTLRTVARDPRWETVLAVSPDGALASRAWPAGMARIAQGRGDLGRRMQRIMDTMPPGPLVIIGSDVADLTRADVARAFAALGPADAVLGPAPDGGYWLVGLARRAPVPALFDGVRWSSRHALADTRANLSGLSVALVTERHDVDTAQDLALLSGTRSS